MADFHTITVRALEHPEQPERSFAFTQEADWTEFRAQAKAAGWSTVRCAAVTLTADVATAMAELAAAFPEEG